MNTATPAAPTSGPTVAIEESPFKRPSGPAELSDLDGVELSRARLWQLSFNWFTDFNTRSVPLNEIQNLLPRDRIKPVDDPQFVTAAAAPDYMRPREPVIALEIDGDARAYPLAILMWQEIVNDTVGGVPVTVTFCPLCNTAITFERTLEGHELTFGTSGNLRNSDLVMWDRQTETWWQQITGEAIVGQLTGKMLRQRPSPIVAWEAFQEQHPEGNLLLREVDGSGRPIRPYDDPPYSGYDSVDNTEIFAFDGPRDGRLPPAMRVLTIKDGQEAIAYPFPFLESAPVVNDSIGDQEIVAFFDNATLSAFNDLSNREQTVGSTTVFSRKLEGRTLTFALNPNGVVDLETGSIWNRLGTATSGPLTGATLEPIVHQNHFWFAWAVFEPDTEIRGSASDVSGPISVVK